jgi:predicted dehydrogenase
VASLRVLVVGVGAHIFSAAHMTGLAAIGAQVVGVHDASIESARRVAAGPGWSVHEELQSLLTVPADVAVVTAPHPAHPRLVIACLQAGLHVLVEKPLGVSVDEADAIVAEAGRCGRVVAVALQHRLRAEVQRARHLLGQGFLGDLHRAVVVSHYPKRAAYFAAAPWRGTWAGEGGGVLINQGQHDLDLLSYLAGQPSRVFGWASTVVQPTQTEDTVEAVVQWPAGATGSIHISSAAAGGPQRIELIGTRGILRILPGELQAVENEVDMRDFSAQPGGPFDQPGTRILPPFAGGGGTHQQLYADLAEALATGRPPAATALDARPALELTNAITLSSHSGEVVELPVDRQAYRSLLAALQQPQGTP